MKKLNLKIPFLAAATLIITASMSVMAFAELTGSGTEDSPYLIGSLQEWSDYLKELNRDKTACGKLTDDIICDPMQPDVRIEGFKDEMGEAFNGTLDGDNHKMVTLNVPLFDFIGPSGKVTNLTVENANVSNANSHYVGIIANKNRGTILDCSVYGAVSSGSNSSGGIAGLNYWGGEIINCKNYASVTGAKIMGGIVGINGREAVFDSSGNYTFEDEDSYGAVSGCFNKGYVGGGQIAGGIVGYNDAKTATIINCYNVGTVAVNEDGNVTAGNAGGITNENEGTIENCYNVGETGNFGGICGEGSIGIVKNCYDALTTENPEENPEENKKDPLKFEEYKNESNVVDGKDLADKLDPEVWEYSEKLGRPQLKDNPEYIPEGNEEDPDEPPTEEIAPEISIGNLESYTSDIIGEEFDKGFGFEITNGTENSLKIKKVIWYIDKTEISPKLENNLSVEQTFSKDDGTSSTLSVDVGGTAKIGMVIYGDAENEDYEMDAKLVKLNSIEIINSDNKIVARKSFNESETE